MYAVSRIIHPPTGVEHCVYNNFFHSAEKNLVVAAVNQLHVFRLIADPEVPVETDIRASDGRKKQRLECLATFSLFGNVMSMQSVKLAGAQRDALLLSFSDAKLSVVEYDPGTHDLQTTSLHYFEEPQLQEGFATTYSIPTIRVDPDGRCAAMLIYGTHLVILPFRREMLIEETETVVPGSKSPIMSSYIIDLRSFDEKITNVIDFQFLQGYFEPTVFILYEPLQTWAGRTAVRTDTSSIVAISLNIQEKVHPVIWSLASLPFDCTQALAVPKPIGGVLVFAVNSLLYLNQSVPPYGVSLNSITDSSSLFPLRHQEGVRITLDCAQAAFMSYDKLVLSLKGGELYVLTLVVDGMRSVRSFHFDKAAASVLTTCVCLCEEGYLFLGSRLGNSLLLKYSEKQQQQENSSGDPQKALEPPVKKRLLDGTADMASDVSQVENLYELEVYGATEHQQGTTITSYVFEVCDNIWNIAPCGHIVLGDPAFLSEEFSNTVDPDLELVTTSGYSKNGALSVLQRSIRPQVVTTFELPGCIDMWTVLGVPESETSKKPLSDEIKKVDKEKKKSEIGVVKKKIGEGEEKMDVEESKIDEGKSETEETETKSEDKEENAEEDQKPPEIEGGHAFLILSREDSSMVLQTGQEIMELDHSGFGTQTPTVFAGNIGDNKYIVQVSPMGVRLLEGVKQLQHIPIDVGSPIVYCSVADPYILLMSQGGSLVLMTLRQDSLGSGARLTTTRPQIKQSGAIMTLCTYRDISGIFTTTAPKEDDSAAASDPKPPKPSKETSFNFDTSTIDDEDELLYGESDTSVFMSSFDTSMKEEGSDKEKKEIKPSYWAFIARDSGVLEIFSLPDFKMCYFVKSFPMGQKVLVDSGQQIESTGKPMISTTSTDKLHDVPVVKELLMVGLGYNKTRPFLMARVEEDLVIYEAFPYFQTPREDHLKLRFKKLQHNLILQGKKPSRSRRKMESEEGELLSKERTANQLRYFEDVSGYSGVFICGSHPHWMFMTSRGSLRIHPMGIDGAINCFAPFHNVNCPKGFLYFNKQGELRIAVLPTHLTYDAPWPIRKVPLRCTPHFLTYHSDSKTYAVVTSVPEICNQQIRLTSEEREFETVEKDDRFIYPTVDRFSCQLYSPTSWEVVPNTKIELEEWEHASCLKYVMLKSQGTVSGLKGYVAMGTVYCFGEDMSARGRIHIFDVIEVVPEPGQPLTKNRIKVEYNKEQKGPVTALSQCNGYLLSAIGQKMYMWSLVENDLIGVAFIDTYIYIHSLTIIKNLILAADISKSIALYRYQEEMKVLSLVSRDIKPLDTYAVEFLVDNTQLSFIVTDKMKNLLLYVYQPEARESHGGTRLLRRGDFNLGSQVHSMFRLRCKQSDPSSGRKALGINERRHITYLATLDGSLGYLLPVSEKVYRRLLMLQNALVTQIQHTAGLNPKSYRAVASPFPDLANPHKNILDGDLLWKYTHLSVMEKNDISKRIGTTNEQIMDDLLEIDRLTAHF